MTTAAVSPNLMVALFGAGSVWLLQIVGVLVWGVMLEMRVRVVESTCTEMKEVRDNVRTMMTELAFMREDLRKLSTAVGWLGRISEYGEGERP